MHNNLHVTMNACCFASRILKETQSLVKAGIFNHVYIAALYEDGLEEHEQIDNDREIWRARLKSRKLSRNLLIQFIKYVEFCFKVIGYARNKHIKVVNVHSLEALPLGVLLKWVLSAKLVYDAHELETETYCMTGVRQKLARVVEATLINFVDLTIVVGDGINDWYRNRYGISNIVTALNCPMLQSPPKSRRLHDELGIAPDRKIVIYQGGLAKGRGIEDLLRTFSDHDDGKHVVVFMGYGELDQLITSYAKKHANIFLQPAVDPSIVLSYTVSADVGIAFINNHSLNDRYCLPNKMFEYIMSGLPVIVNDVPEMSRLVRENSIGVVLQELTPESLKNALEQIAQMAPDALAANLRKTGKLCSWENQSDKMIEAYRKYVSK